VSRAAWLVLIACALAAAPAAPVAAQSIGANCDTPSGRDSCNRWYTDDWVALSWQWPAGGLPIAGCSNQSLLAEAPAERHSCTVQWVDATVTRQVWIGIDRTPPQLVGLQPVRPPGPNGWFNRPIDLTFLGSDQTSGVASCSSTTYGGPDGIGVAIGGSCRDVAGNVGSGSLPINYDATPPARPSVEAVPGNRRVALEWSHVPGVDVEVVRSRKGGKTVVVFRGASDRLTDRGLHNGRRYGYVVTLIDQAGNRAAEDVSVVPTSSPLLLPARGARVHGAPMLVWRPVRRARYYNAQLMRRGHKVLTRWPRVANLQLRRSWSFDGRRHRLVPGRYCWYVWPGFGKRSDHRYGHLLGKSCFTVTRG
jgi:hypothetical protein